MIELRSAGCGERLVAVYLSVIDRPSTRASFIVIPNQRLVFTVGGLVQAFFSKKEAAPPGWERRPMSLVRAWLNP